jgi:hypothetical protein
MRSHYYRRQIFITQAIPLKNPVVRNNSQLLYAGLSHQHPIERIAVHRRQTTGG